MEGFSFLTPVTGLNRPNTGKEDDDHLKTNFKASNPYTGGRHMYYLPVHKDLKLWTSYIPSLASKTEKKSKYFCY
jgi:hypothetical protein